MAPSWIQGEDGVYVVCRAQAWAESQKLKAASRHDGVRRIDWPRSFEQTAQTPGPARATWKKVATLLSQQPHLSPKIPLVACFRLFTPWYVCWRKSGVDGLLTHTQSNNPTQIFADDVTEEKGENARLSAFVGAIAVGDLVKSTLGPKGMDKILQSAYGSATPPCA